MILLDTNVVSETMRSAPDATVMAWLDEQIAETLHLSAVSLAELLLGVALLPDGHRKSTLDQLLNGRVPAMFGPRMLVFDREAAQAYSRIVSGARAEGLTIDVADGQIAATAAVHRLTVATRDTVPFEAARSNVINPWIRRE